MAKKSQKAKKNKVIVTAQPRHLAQRMDQLTSQLMDQDFRGAVENGTMLLNYLPQCAPQRVDVLMNVAIAYMQLEQFAQSYRLFTEALALAPTDTMLLYNHALASMMTMRSVQSLRDLERALTLEPSAEIRKKIEDQLPGVQEVVEHELKLRGKDFTPDQLYEQQKLYQRGVDLVEQGKMDAAEIVFKQVIATADCLPQPHNNLATCYITQKRFDEAEEELKRAIAIEPGYELARRNLRAMPQLRREGGVNRLGISHPLAGQGMKQTINFMAD